MITKTDILDKTQGGLQLYAYVLQQYYPGDSLYLEGNHCRLVRNPFNNGKKSLKIDLKNGLAFHRDVEQPDLCGDAFDFANKHFGKATLGELYHAINEQLPLGLKSAVEENLEWLDAEDDSWRPEVSFFRPPIRNVLPSKTLSLWEVYQLLTGPRLMAITQELRSLTDAREIRQMKAARFPYVCFSGSFRRRSDQELIKHSRLLVFDFDHLANPQEVWQTLLTDPQLETELLFTSPSGNGIKWVTSFDPEEFSHRKFFEAVSIYLERQYGLEADKSGKDVSRACFLCHAENAFLHPRHRIE